MTAGEAFGLPADFDLDGWIDGATRATETVRIYGKGHLNDELREIERQMRLLRDVPAEERSVTDATPEALQQRWDDVAAELVASALPLKVHALTNDEIQRAREEAKRDKATGDVEVGLYVLAAAIVEPKGITVPKLRKIREKAGDAGLGEALAVVMRLSNDQARPTVPFSPRPSGGRRG